MGGGIIMRKEMFILSAMAMVAAASCTKEIVDVNKETASDVELFPMTFTASSQQTKAEMVDAQTIHWQSGDQINVFDGTANVYEPFTTSDKGASVTFEGMAGKAEGYYALYPYQSSATMTDGTIIATFPSEQTAVAGSFDPKAFISVAQSDAEGNFSFKNVAALVKFTMPVGENATSATLTANADKELLCGPVKITFDENGNPSAPSAGKMTNAVTLKGNLEGGKTYYFVVRPGIAFSEGLTISIDGKKYRTSSTKLGKTLVRNSVMALPEFTFKEGMPKDLYTAYEHGFDLQIGGQKFDKATYGEATLITTTISAPKAGIYFLNPEIEQPMGSNIEHMAIIGRYADQRSLLTRTDFAYLNSTDASDNYLILANVEYKVSDLTKNYCMVINKTGAFENIVFDNIKVSLPNAIKLVYCGTSNDRSIKNFTLKNSDISIGASPTDASYTAASTTYLVQIDGSTEGETVRDVSSVVIENNTVNGVEGNVKRFRLFSVEKSDIGSLTLNNNVIKNCYTYYGYVASYTGAYNISSVSGNLFYIPDHGDVAQWYAIVYPKKEQGSTNEYKAVATNKFADNTAYYGGTTPDKYLRSLYGTGTNSPTAVAANPLN